MKLHNAVQDQPIVSNVGEIGEFRIRNSAKAFNILSSGLYANKIRAIIRELSCNAVDSHVAAGKSNTPFDVHLPNQLEPHFSIRDYGTGLSHEQVKSIYTTYFESTKTNSNEFIGALGLGSKSPFSYTDNFTVTAVQGGKKGIYTAFINEQGVPSIALMMEEETTDPNGVEVKFSVNERYDFHKFVDEARNVYTHFKLRPVIHGCKDFVFTEPAYKDRDIIKGVHTIDSRRSTAIMGNIAYPIEVPNAETVLGELRKMLECGLVMEFDIGELDFQASREGLSYIPSTVQAIKNKLEQLNNQLAIHIATEADKFSNFWDRANYLSTRHNETLWCAATAKYVQDTKFPLSDSANYQFLKSFDLSIDELRRKYNINIRAFSKDRGADKCTNLKTQSVMDSLTKTYIASWKIIPTKNVHIVVTDTVRGALERAKYHWRKTKQTEYSETVIVIEKFDKNRILNADQFLKDIYNPPRVHYASQLLEKERENAGNWAKANILRLEENRRSRHTTAVSWSNAGKASDFDNTKTYYYVELKGWSAIGLPISDIKDYYQYLNRSGIHTGHIYGVRKNDIESIKTQKNWVELTEYVREQLKKVDTGNVMSMVKQAIDYRGLFKYDVFSKLNQNSPYVKLHSVFKDVGDFDSTKKSSLEILFKAYGIVTNTNIDPNTLIKKYKLEVENVKKRYPLLSDLSYYPNKDAIAEYINLVDQVKGV